PIKKHESAPRAERRAAPVRLGAPDLLPESLMERQAFARALRFLNYLPLAKWSALVASVGAGVLFVGLLTVLALFADLMINRGQLPAFPQLLSRAQRNYLQRDHARAVAQSNMPLEAHLRQRFESLWKDA